MAQRPYLCKPTANMPPDAKPRLVMAGTPAAARLHVTKNLYTIDAASSAEVATAMQGGITLEQASADGATGDLPGTTAPQP